MKKAQFSSQSRYLILIALFIFVAILCLSIGYFGGMRPLRDGRDDGGLSRAERDAKQMLRECQSKKAEKESCYIDKFTELTKKNLLEYSLKVFSSMREADSSANGCHFIAHVIATTEVRKNPAKWEDVLGKIPSDDCTGGFIMGVMEGHKLSDKNFTFDADSLSFICSKMVEKTGGVSDDQTCAHTMGHLLLVEKEGDVSSAILVCDKVNKEYQYECAAGVFMENLYRRNLFDHGVGESFAWNKETLLVQEKLCSSYGDLSAKACWRELSHMYVVLEKEPQKILQSCSKAGAENFQDACYLHAVGVMTLLSSSSTSLEGFCVPYSDNAAKLSSCVDAVAGALLDSSSKLARKAAEFCRKYKGISSPNCQKADLMVY